MKWPRPAGRFWKSAAVPHFFEAMTYRWNEHVGPSTDWHLGYRDQAEMETWKKIDPILTLADEMDPATKARLDKEIEAEIKEAVDFAEKSPLPDPAELYTEVFA